MRTLIVLVVAAVLFSSPAVAEKIVVAGLPSSDDSPEDREPCGTIATCPGPEPGALVGGVAWDGTHIWVGVFFGSDTLYKIDPVSCQVVYTIPSPVSEGVGGLAWDGSHLWCCPEQSGQIYELDPADGSVISVIPAPSYGEPDPNAAGLAWDGQYLWHTDYGHQALYKLDPTDGSIVTTYPMTDIGLSGVGYGGGVVVVIGYGTDKLYEVDPSDGSVISTCDVPDSHAWGAAVAGSVWTSGTSTETLYLLDVVVTPVELWSWGAMKALYQ